MTHPLRRSLLVAAVLSVASAAFGGQTQKWLADTEAAFREGKVKNLVLTSSGELRLSREFKAITASTDEIPALINALVQGPDGTIYAATGPEGKILAIKDGKTSTFATLDSHPLLTALLVDDKGNLLVGASGEKASLFKITPTGEKTTLLEDDDTQYIWGMAKGLDGTIYVATGPNGKLFSLSPAAGAKPELLFHTTQEENFTAIAVSPTTGHVYLGTDINALVIRLDPKTKQTTVLFDAPEPEIGALIFDPKGNLYVATTSPDSAGMLDTPPDHPSNGMPETTPQNTDPTLPDNLPPMVPPPAAPKKEKQDLLGSIRSRGGWAAHHPMIRTLQPAPEEPPQNPDEPHGDPLKPHKKGKSTAPATIQIPVPGPGNSIPSEGNAVYRIDSEGFVSEVFRAPVTFYGMSESNGVLTLATGSEGLLYQVDTLRDESSQLARAEGAAITALLPLKDGTVVVGVSNPGSIATLSSSQAQSGTYTSPVLDASAVARFGTLRLEGSLPEGTKLTLSTRSGNTAEPPEEENPLGWNPWTTETPAQRFIQVSSPPARYFQYRLTFSPSNTGSTPLLRVAEASYSVPNAAPKVTSLTVSDAVPEPGKGLGPAKTIAWDATDPNGDTLTYSLQYRPSGESEWRPLREKLTETSLDLDSRELPDGRYQLRVVASDSSSNAPGAEKSGSRLSTSFLVDNTPPTFSAVTSKVSGKSAILTFSLNDAAGTVASVQYRVDAGPEWRSAEAGDKLFDSPAETVKVSTGDLSPGKHVVQLKATDDRGNERFESVLIEIP